jgi:hypothetical protein
LMILLNLRLMKLMFYKSIVFAAFGLLLIHNITPHHHHDHPLASKHTHQHPGQNNHDHPLSFHSVDETFILRYWEIKLVDRSVETTLIPVVLSFSNGTIEGVASGFFTNRCADPPSHQFLSACSFRGPPFV